MLTSGELPQLLVEAGRGGDGGEGRILVWGERTHRKPKKGRETKTGRGKIRGTTGTLLPEDWRYGGQWAPGCVWLALIN